MRFRLTAVKIFLFLELFIPRSRETVEMKKMQNLHNAANDNAGKLFKYESKITK